MHWRERWSGLRADKNSDRTELRSCCLQRGKCFLGLLLLLLLLLLPRLSSIPSFRADDRGWLQQKAVGGGVVSCAFGSSDANLHE